MIGARFLPVCGYLACKQTLYKILQLNTGIVQLYTRHHMYVFISQLKKINNSNPLQGLTLKDKISVIFALLELNKSHLNEQ